MFLSQTLHTGSTNTAHGKASLVLNTAIFMNVSLCVVQGTKTRTRSWGNKPKRLSVSLHLKQSVSPAVAPDAECCYDDEQEGDHNNHDDPHPNFTPPHCNTEK